MGELWRLIEDYRDAQPYPPSIRRIAERAGLNNATVNKWQKPSGMPKQEHLLALAVAIQKPYEVVLRAALLDAGYLDASVESLTEEQMAVAFAPGLTADQRRRILSIIQERRPAETTQRGRLRKSNGG